MRRPRAGRAGRAGRARPARTVALGIAAGFLVVCSGASGVTAAQAYQYRLLSAASPCAAPPAAAATDTSLITATPTASASATPSATTSPTASPTSTPTPTSTPNPSQNSSPSASPSASPTPSQTPTPTPSTPSPTPAPEPKTAKLCVLVQAFLTSSVDPGGNASYEIWVWSTVTEAEGVSVTASVGSAAHVNAPQFSVCPRPKGDTCTVGDLPTSQSEALLASAHVRDAASAGERIKLTATVRGTKAGSFHAAATVDVVAASTPSSSISPEQSSALGPSESLPPLPGSSLTSPTDPSGLFPTVSPDGSNSPSGRGGQNARRLHARLVSATLPLDGRLIDGQLAGLAVLAAAVTVAIVRLSLRGARPQDGGDGAK
jgi:hypothetical protein